MKKGVVSLGSTKEAALYFDRVLPVDVFTAAIAGTPQEAFELSECVPYENDGATNVVFQSLLPEITDPYTVSMSLMSLQMCSTIIGHDATPGLGEKRIGSLLEPAARYVKDHFGINIDPKAIASGDQSASMASKESLQKITKSLGFETCPTWIPENIIDRSNEDTSDDIRFALSLSNLNLIDPKRITWESVVEFRKDKKSMIDLRNLRLFFQEELNSKDVSYASDKLAQLEENQRATARLWGFETVQKSLSVAFSNQNALVTSVSGLAAAFGGASLPLIAGATLAFPLGNFALEMSKAIIDSKKEKVHRPTQFLTRLRNLGK